MITLIKDEFSFQIFSPAKNDMSFNYPDLRDRERTCIKEKVKSRDKSTCSKFPCNPVKKTGSQVVKFEAFKAFEVGVLQGFLLDV